METTTFLNCSYYVTWDVGRAVALKCSSINYTCTYTGNTYSKLRVKNSQFHPPPHPLGTKHSKARGSNPRNLAQQDLRKTLLFFFSFKPLQRSTKRVRIYGASQGRQYKQELYLISSFWTIEKNFQCKAFLRGFFHADPGITATKLFSQQES